MTTDDKLAAILAAVQIDPGNRGLARDPVDNLFTACPGDFKAACAALVPDLAPHLITGFCIPTCTPPTFETDGPLGTLFLARAFLALGKSVHISYDHLCTRAMRCAHSMIGFDQYVIRSNNSTGENTSGDWIKSPVAGNAVGTHAISVERVGPAGDGRYYTMRGRDVTDLHLPAHHMFRRDDGLPLPWRTIAIGDGGNEIGMGKIPHETIVKNIPNGDLIHCRVPADHLIVAGVSNWGAYALAAGVFVLSGRTPPTNLFDPDVEKRILEVMVKEGPLVDGVTGEPTATVDGLSWNDYIAPLLKMRTILGLD